MAKIRTFLLNEYLNPETFIDDNNNLVIKFKYDSYDWTLVGYENIILMFFGDDYKDENESCWDNIELLSLNEFKKEFFGLCHAH